ncbi:MULTISPECIES: right-handed parallel beta-helix repeat-containing protein [unclassified Lentimonas]|uniref:right-handed parallel beta-helix repeat-containing protein n=1 Tax=unclassified Lentimonas TaxID=2630993 RepID=UPI0013282B4F|nr:MULTISPECIES: right-handed parallel beta-helix repeat-containing protein [unclassified Lentimonas]CAA6696513.1 Unannotated [Lentimonas sp. CC19]CAA6696678.1 Unannotated [Lentimonas sp. CC10]CAA7072441.1 Unannotated [Lentimonas sp. CC11]
MPSFLLKNACQVILSISFLFACAAEAKQVIKIDATAADMTPVIRKALEGATDTDVTLVFAKGVYKFLPDYATNRYCYITNHGNGQKNVIFPLEGFDSIEIDGNGSEFIFHGQVAPFQFKNCSKVTVKSLTIDWDIPFTFLGEVMAVNEKEGWRDIKPFTEGFSWVVQHNQLKFPNIDGFNYTKLGSTLAFDAEHKRVAHGVWDMESDPRWVEKRKGGILRFHEPLKRYPPVGSLLSSKGNREDDRYAPAFQTTTSKTVRFEDVVIHHALGMGFLFERTEDITLSNSGVYLREGSPRVISSTADATHFANCKGDILIENCRFENMLDDATNVHGTYVEVDRVIDDHTVRVKLKHFEQLGFEFAGKGDAVWFIQQPNPQRGSENEVTAVSVVNDRYTDLHFKDPIPSKLMAGDVLENKTWNPSFTMRGCTLRNHRARNIVLKTPLKTVIEDNDFSSMMSAIFFRGETYFWFESGAVQDVLIRNNRFEYCAYSGMEHGILTITPRLGAAFDTTTSYDRNIRFIDNTIHTFDNRIVWADRVDGLVISGNTITQMKGPEPIHPECALFELKNCHNVEISNNTYQGSSTHALDVDPATEPTLKVSNNQGF